MDSNITMLFFQITIAQAFLSVIAWSPFAALCLQFLFRNPKVTSATASVIPPLFAKAVTAIMPLVYKLNTSVKKSNGPNGTDHAKDVQNDKAEWHLFVGLFDKSDRLCFIY